MVDRNVQRKTAATKVKTEAAKDSVKKEVAAKPTRIFYVSANEEPISFDIRIKGQKIKPYWTNNKKTLVWDVPLDLEAAFDAHEFVVKKRIIKSDKG